MLLEFSLKPLNAIHPFLSLPLGSFCCCCSSNRIFLYTLIYLDTKPNEKNTWMQHFCFLSDTYVSQGLASLLSWLTSNAYGASYYMQYV